VRGTVVALNASLCSGDRTGGPALPHGWMKGRLMRTSEGRLSERLLWATVGALMLGVASFVGPIIVQGVFTQEVVPAESRRVETSPPTR